MHHGSVVVIEDCESNEHCSLTVYHQELDAILTKNDDGYIVLNPEVVESIKKTAEAEEEQPVEESEEESEEESDDCCLEVEVPEVDKRGEENVDRRGEENVDRRGEENVEAKRQRVE